jgi:hypothetical protein
MLAGSGHSVGVNRGWRPNRARSGVVVRYVEADHRGRQRGQNRADAGGHYRHRDCYPREQCGENVPEGPQCSLIITRLRFFGYK